MSNKAFWTKPPSQGLAEGILLGGASGSPRETTEMESEIGTRAKSTESLLYRILQNREYQKVSIHAVGVALTSFCEVVR
jgi:hypothetical protein